MIEAGARAAKGIELDHLVVACRTLDDGRAWCESSFGVAPAPGGRHAMMGTHNLLLSTSSPRFPRSYIELIAIDPDAPPPTRARWFELDDAALQARIASSPQLVHWVARSDDIGAAESVLRGAGFDPGPVVDAERMTARGLLRWRIAIPADGHRHANGAVPLLIEWGDVHPSDDLPAIGVELRSVGVGGVAVGLATRLGADALDGASAPSLSAQLATPRGVVRLSCA